MAANPALWADILRDIEAARSNADGLAARASSLDEHGSQIAADVRLDREIAVGSMLHNCYGAMENALERLIDAVDGSRPTGAGYHAELIRRAAMPIPSIRPAIISAHLAAELHKLRSSRHAFRHAYGECDYARAAENVAIALCAVPAFDAGIRAFAISIGIVDKE
jgi:hypothetical protein